MLLSRFSRKFAFLILISITFILGSFHLVSAATNPSATYSFDEGTGTTAADSSGNGNTGTLTNSPTWTTGKYGTGLSFNGTNNYVLVPTSASLDISGTNISIEFWANIVTGSGSDYVLLDKPWNPSTMASPYYQYGVEYGNRNTKTLDFYFGDTTGALHGPFSMTPTTGTWQHYAFTYDGSSVKGFISGVQQFSTAQTGSIQARGQSLRMGVDGAFSQPYQGLLDDVRIYNRTLTQAEIQTDMNTPVSGTPPSSDTTVPSTPAGLTATAVSSSQINLSWTASTDNVGVTGYKVYRGGTQIATVAGLSYNDTGLAASTAYSYTIAAYDAAGNTSAQSSSVSATTQIAAAPDTTPPSVPPSLTATAVSSSQINLAWTASTDNVGVTGYKIFRNSTQLATITGLSYSDTGLTASTLYSYTVSAYDAAGNNSVQSVAASATTQVGSVGTNPIDNLNPGEWYEVPNSNVSAINPCPANNCNYSGATGQKSVIEAWSGGAYDTKRNRLILWGGGHGDYAGNEIYAFDVNTLKWAMLTTPSTNIGLGETYPDGRPSSRHTYGGLLYLANVDRLWASNGSVWNTGNCTVGTWMYDFTASPPESGWSRQVDAPGDPKCGAVSAYDSVTGLPWFNGKGGLQTFNPGNVSSPWTQRNQELSVPNYLSGAVDTKRRKLVMIGSGSAFIHDISLSGTVARQTLVTSGATEIVNANAPGLAYDQVSDRIVAWNGGSAVYTLNMDTLVWTKVNPAPSNTVIPTQVTAAGGTFGRFQYIPSKNAFIAVNATNENVYIYKLSSGGGTSPPPPSDTTVPSTPAGLTATTVSSSQINLSWTASTDNVGVTGYKVFRNGTQIATVTTTSYSDTGLTASTLYSYTVQAYDAAGNNSAQSVAASATTQGSTSIKFVLNDRVQVSSGPLNVRATANTTGTLLGTQATGALGTVIGGPIAQGGFNWWNINYDTGVDGWSAEDFLVKYVAPPPPSTGTIGGYPMPMLQDERNTYTSWGWTWSASVEPAAVTEPTPGYFVDAAGVDVRNDPEADDLWNYLMMYRRTGNPVYLNRANAWLRYFKQDYVTDVVNDNAVNNHLFGWGLIAWYEYTCAQGACDTAALSVAEQIGALAEQAWASAIPGQTAMAYYGARRAGRPLLLATRLAEVTKKQRWIDLRDRLINLWIQSPDWDTRGIYEIGQDDTDTVAGTGAYAAGYRVQSAFQIGILSEAFDYAYRATGNALLRDRIISMARFVNQYGLDATYQYTGSYFGLNPSGTAWHNHFANCGTTCTSADPAYTTSLVNTLVRGYKYTGDTTLLNRAKVFFNRGTKGIYGSLARSAPDNGIHHFVDTRFSSDQFYLSYNKGELQYTYLIFENGGNPTVEGTSPPPSSDTTFPSVSLSAPANGATVSGTVTVSATASDNIGVAGVQFKLDNANLGAEDTTSPYSTSWNTTSATNGVHTLTAVARDAAGNTTTASSVTVTVSNTATDTTAPSIPTNLTATAVSSSQINLTWTASTDPVVAGQTNSGVSGYRIYRSGVQIATSPTPSFNNIGLTAATTYSYTVAAVDAAGNVSAQGASASATTQSITSSDTTFPSVSLSAPANGATVSGTVTVSATASDNVGVVGVQFKLDGANLNAEDTTSPYSTSWNTTSATNGTHALTAVARDAAGNTTTATARTVTVSNTAPDTINPVVTITTPTAATTYATTASSVTLGGTASDNVGVTQVTWSNAAGGSGTAAGTTAWSATMTLQTGTNAITVTARDAAGNTSTDTLTITYTPITPPDTTSPSVPTNLTATAVSSSQINLSWSASTDNIAVTGYKVYTNGIQVATTTTTSYNHQNLSPFTTYSYTVSAYDAAGNTSAPTASVSATTQAVAQTPPPSAGGGGNSGSSGGSSGGSSTGSTSSGSSGSNGGSLGGAANGGSSTPRASGLTSAQIQAILSLLSSFGADSATVANISAILTGTTLPATSPSGTIVSFQSNLYFGMTSNNVTKLQQFLAKDPSVYPEALVTGYYGSLTVKAVQRFQAKYGIVSSGSSVTTGYGAVGPQTRAKLNALGAGL